jgi:protein-disulfide isomerase
VETDTSKDAMTQEEVKPDETNPKNIPTEKIVTPRGGFMNGGVFLTVLFLFAFFLVSFYAGMMTERVNKFVTGVIPSNTANSAGNSKFGVEGFKKIAAGLKLDTKKFDACLDTGKYAEAVKKDQQEGISLRVGGTPTFVINGTALVGAHPAETFISALDNGSFPLDKEGSASGSIYDGQKITQAISTDEKARIKGDPNAKITIVEYSDFECPYCGKFYQQSYKDIVEKYVKTGKAKVVFKDFPLSQLHPNAQKAAEAARCAQEQNKFWEMHDKLFELQLS